MREIGSEFWEVPVRNSDSGLFPERVQWYLSGRSALQAIVRELDRTKPVYLPSWCCESMIRPFADAEMEVLFYSSLPDEKGPALLFPEKGGTLLVMDYFGYTADPANGKRFPGTVIRDVTHSIFSAAYNDADLYFGSFRKWCGVWTGGFAWAKDGHLPTEGKPVGTVYTEMRREAMRKKEDYILERVGEDGKTPDKSYLTLFAEAEDYLENCRIEAAEERDVRLAEKVDADYIRRQRRANAGVLRDAFSEWLLFPEMKETDCPMFVPILIPGGKRDSLRQYLTSHEIYCPVHWPLSPLHSADERLKTLVGNELSLVCDQRYREDDMGRIVETIWDFMRGRG